MNKSNLKNYIKLFIIFVFLIVSLVSVHTPVDARDEGTSSYELTYDETLLDNQTLIISYKDGDENIIKASNLPYAYIQVELDDSKNHLTEHYYDINDTPIGIWSGQYGIQRSFNKVNECIEYTYLDSNDQPYSVDNNTYTTVKREFDNQHRCILETYYKDNKVVHNSNGVYGLKYTYDSNSTNISSVTYLDDTNNQVIQESYYDKNHNLISHINGYYGLLYGYDEYGRQYKTTYLGKDLKPMIIDSLGYASIERTYYKNNSVKTEMYYDSQGQPVKLSRGESGIYNKIGQTQYLNSKGKVMFLPDIFLRSNPYVVIVLGIVVVVTSLLLSKKYNYILLVLYIGFIAYMTLLNRTGVSSNVQLRLFATYKTFISSYTNRLFIIENIWLFIPLTIILYKLYPKIIILLIPIILSICIELVQYIYGLGISDIDDILSNVLGVMIGYLIINTYHNNQFRNRQEI